MSSEHPIGSESMVEGETNAHTKNGFEVIDEVAVRGRNLQPGVEQGVRATIDYSDDDPLYRRLFGRTLEAQERGARKWEIERTRRPWARNGRRLPPQDNTRVLMSYDGPDERSSTSALTANGRSTSTQPAGTPWLSYSTPEGSTTEAVATSRVKIDE